MSRINRTDRATRRAAEADVAHRPAPDARLVQRLPTLAIDLDDALEAASFRLVEASLQAALDSGLFDAPLSERALEYYGSSTAVFETWCATREDAIEPLKLSPGALTAIIATFLAWLATDIDATDRALGLGPGQRQKRTALKASSIAGYANAIRWWAAKHGLDDPVPAAASDLVAARSKDEPARQAAPFGREEIRILLAAIRRGPAACGDYPPGTPTEERRPSRPDRVERWIAGNTAAVLVQFCGGLRIGERLRIRDEWVTVGEDRITIRWPSTKSRPEGRSVDLFGDPDVDMCPVRALVRWLDVAQRQSLDRQGLLLPDVTTRRLRTKPDIRASLPMFKRIARAAGLEDNIDFERHYIGTHSIRRGTATSLAALGVDLEHLRRLLGHAKVSTTLRYVDRSMIEPTDWSEELGL